MPKICPIDGSKIVRDGVAFRCPNPVCGARHRESLYHFVVGFGIDGLGPKIIDRFLDEGLISGAADIFTLEAGEIKVLERFGEKSAQNIIEEIQSQKTIDLKRFIYSFGILHVGEETAVALAKQVSGIKYQVSRPKDVLKAFQKMTPEDLQKIPDIGPKVSESIHKWFREKRNIKFVEKLDKVGVKITYQKITRASQRLVRLWRKTFVLTGTLESMSRDQAKSKIRSLGGDVSSSVSKQTDYVVAGSNPGSKYENAKSLGVKIIDEREFLKLMTS